MGLKNLFLLCLAVVLMVSIVLWFSQTETDKSPISQPNLISQQEDDHKPTDKKNSSQQPAQKPNVSAFDIIYETPNEPSESSKITYLMVYRIFRNLDSCQSVLYRLSEDQKMSPVSEFSDRIQKQQKEENPYWPTAKQIRSVVQHAKSCQNMLSQIEALGFNDSANASTSFEIKDWVRQHLSKMTPMTAKELAIADVLSLSELWQSSFDDVLNTSKGDDRMEQPEVDLLQAQINALESEAAQLSSLDRDMRTQQESDRIHEIWLKIRKLKEQIIQVKKVNLTERNQAIITFESVNALLFKKLHSQDPDVFFEAQTTLEMNQLNHLLFGYAPYKNIGVGSVSLPFIEYVSPGEVIQSILGIQDDSVFAMLINHATKIYHCELGADCGPGGRWSLLYCHVGYGYFYESACDKGLLRFYQDDYLSENQWQDVQHVVNTLRSTYAIQ